MAPVSVATDLLARFIGADPGLVAEDLTLSLRPADSEYDAVFVGPAVGWAAAGYRRLWDSRPAITATSRADNLEVAIAPSHTLATPKGLFPGGYARVAQHLRPGVDWLAWRFVGGRATLAYDGLVWIGERWVWFPRPWRFLDFARHADLF